jgi:hypothetical protein
VEHDEVELYLRDRYADRGPQAAYVVLDAPVAEAAR